MTRLIVGLILVVIFAASMFFGTADLPAWIPASTIALGFVGLALIISGTKKLSVSHASRTVVVHGAYIPYIPGLDK